MNSALYMLGHLKYKYFQKLNYKIQILYLRYNYRNIDHLQKN